MKKLGVAYIDMVLLHWPFGNVYDAWRVLEEYYYERATLSVTAFGRHDPVLGKPLNNT